MAIMNLQAMLDIDDMDKIIQLLEQNGWDEAQAANAHFAQQVASGDHAQNNEMTAGGGDRDQEAYREAIQY